MPTSVASVHQPQGATGSPTTSSIGTDNKQDKKPTVLETHGYFLGRTIGTGSYATVRVRKGGFVWVCFIGGRKEFFDEY